MGELMTVQTQLIGNMTFAAQAGSGHTVLLDAAERSGGRDLGFRPMELLLVGLSGCTAMDVISILRKKRQEITHYEVRVQGERAEGHPMVFTDITVEHIVTGHHVDPEAVARAVELSATKYCGAGAMLGKTARLRHTFRIVESIESAEALAHSG